MAAGSPTPEIFAVASGAVQPVLLLAALRPPGEPAAVRRATTAEPGAACASGVVMEFRNMKRDIPPKDWSTLALGSFDYLTGVNARP